MSRRKMGRMKVEAPDEGTARRYLLWLPGERLHHEPESLPRISSAALFGNERPLELEVGCGTGEFLCSRAGSRPQTNFVGVDLHVKSLYRAVSEASERGLDNVMFARADFRLLYPLLAPESLLAVYLLFPDPGMKERERRRRIFSGEFLRRVHRALEPGGRLTAMTDHEGYLSEMLALSRRAEGWEMILEDDPGGGTSKTRFQSLWESRGRSARGLTLVKVRSDG